MESAGTIFRYVGCPSPTHEKDMSLRGRSYLPTYLPVLALCLMGVRDVWGTRKREPRFFVLVEMEPGLG